MKLLLKRLYFEDSYTIGKLYINNTYFCDTLEDKNRDLNKNGKFDNGEYKVQNETCIPFGEYEIKLFKSPKFNRVLPKLLNVPNFEGILIHRGNTSKDTSGCILVGENKEKGKVLNSTIYELRLVNLISNAVKNNEKITINII